MFAATHINAKTRYCIFCFRLITESCSTWYELLFPIIGRGIVGRSSIGVTGIRGSGVTGADSAGANWRCSNCDGWTSGSGVVGRSNMGITGIRDSGVIGVPNLGVAGIWSNRILGANERKVNGGCWVSNDFWYGIVAEISCLGLDEILFTDFWRIKWVKLTDGIIASKDSCWISCDGSWECCMVEWMTSLDNVCSALSKRLRKKYGYRPFDRLLSVNQVT